MKSREPGVKEWLLGSGTCDVDVGKSAALLAQYQHLLAEDNGSRLCCT